MTLAELPDPTFVGWFPWSALRGGALDHETAHALQQVGTYLIAHFPAEPPSTVNRTDENIFYVGETHGPTRSLRARLTHFGKSAGFLGEQRAGHYAAWSFPEYAKANNIGASSVYVAVCPYVAAGDKAPADARGVFPTLIEAMVLWSYTQRHGRMPALNNSGKQYEPEPAPTWDPSAVHSMLTEPDPYLAAEQLLASIAQAHGYAPRAFKRWSLDGWSGIERPFGKGYWGSIGWRHDVREIGMWLTNGKDYRFDTDGRSATDESELRSLLGELWREI